jgi:cytochrome c peroxidase
MNSPAMGTSNWPGIVRLAAAVAAAGAAFLCVSDAMFAAEQAGRAEWQKNYHRPAEIPFPKSNPYSGAKVKLGKTLFFDPILSGSNVRSCATCHNPGLSWGDGRGRALGEGQKPLPLRSPTLLNIAWVPKLGWDGHFRDLESVAMGPISGTTNMNLPESEMIARLTAIPAYVEAFHAAFGEGGITRKKIEMALGTYERTIVSPEAPFDRWIAGDEKPSVMRPNGASIYSTARQIARPVTAAGHLPMHHFTTSAAPPRTTSVEASCFRHR